MHGFMPLSLARQKGQGACLGLAISAAVAVVEVEVLCEVLLDGIPDQQAVLSERVVLQEQRQLGPIALCYAPAGATNGWLQVIGHIEVRKTNYNGRQDM